jgi:hypothetical protein
MAFLGALPPTPCGRLPRDIFEQKKDRRFGAVGKMAWMMF